MYNIHKSQNHRVENSVFSVALILCDINFGETRCCENAICVTYEFCLLDKYQPSKSAKIHQNPNSEPLDVLNWLILHFKDPQIWFHVKSAW